MEGQLPERGQGRGQDRGHADRLAMLVQHDLTEDGDGAILVIDRLLSIAPDLDGWLAHLDRLVGPRRAQDLDLAERAAAGHGVTVTRPYSGDRLRVIVPVKVTVASTVRAPIENEEMTP